MTNPNKAELRRVAHDASESEMGWLDAERLKRFMVDDWADFVAAANPDVVLSLLDSEAQAKCEAGHAIEQKDAAYAECKALRAERDAALAELEAIRGLLVQCTLSAETLRTDSLGHAHHCGFGDRMVSAMRRLSGVKPGHGLGSRDYPSQAAAIDAAMPQEANHA